MTDFASPSYDGFGRNPLGGLVRGANKKQTPSDHVTRVPGAPAPHNQLPVAPQAGGQDGQPQLSPQEAMATLTHLGEVHKRLAKLIQDPELGRQNLRGKIFDAIADLLGNHGLTLPQAMNAIKDLGADPGQQRQWLQQKMLANMQAQQIVLEDFRQLNPGSGDWQADAEQMGKAGADHDALHAVAGRYRAAGRR